MPNCPYPEDGQSPEICCPGGQGVFLPFSAVSEHEQAGDDGVRAVMYFLALGWCFVGVALVSDVFMAAIEVITSKTRCVWLDVDHPDNPDASSARRFHVRVWNDTVANLTLMALGSSAPEILLSVIEILNNKFYAGRLGPSVIVGSAAFNFLMITAICTNAIPDGEIRYINDQAVFAVTCSASLLAYLWMYTVLAINTPDEITTVEGVLTLVYFPILVLIAYLADANFFSCGSGHRQPDTARIVGVSEDQTHCEAPALEDSGVVNSAEKWTPAKPECATISHVSVVPDAAHIVSVLPPDEARPAGAPRPSHNAWFQEPGGLNKTSKRMSHGGVLRERQSMAIGKSILVPVMDGPNDLKNKIAGMRASFARHAPGISEEEMRKLIDHELQAEKGGRSRAYYRVNAVREMTGTRAAKVVKSHAEVEKVLSQDNGAPSKRHSRDKHTDSIEFAAPSYSVLESCGQVKVDIVRNGDTTKEAKVKCSTKDMEAKAGDDYIALEEVIVFAPGQADAHVLVTVIDDVQWELDKRFTVHLETLTECPVQLGNHAVTTITIIDDDEPGVLEFKTEVIEVLETEQYAEIIVERHHGCSGVVSCSYYTEDGTAAGGVDFEALSGEVTFEHGETAKSILVKIADEQKYQRNDYFSVFIKDPKAGATFNTKTEGGEEFCRCAVHIKSDDVVMTKVDKLAEWIGQNADKDKLGSENWKQQFVEAFYCNGSPEDQAEADASAWAMHILAFPWKIIFAFTPPTDYAQGYLTFLCSLGIIGLLTAIVGDIAELLGCVLQMPPEIAAITLVALGTSLPDTFASRTAAVQDEHADASVGNVTGSNAVNVFLGLGLPWSMGALYWASDGAPQDEWLKHLHKGVPYGEKFPEKWGALVVPADSLGFSVGVYTGCALSAVALMLYRRKSVGGELGGPGKFPTSLAFALLWFTYIALSIWQLSTSE